MEVMRNTYGLGLSENAKQHMDQITRLSISRQKSNTHLISHRVTSQPHKQ